MKERIKEWLKSKNRDREWLAGEIGVNKRTVDNWLSSPKVIPVGKLKLIERLMEDDEAAETKRRQQLQPTAQVFSIEVDLSTFRAYSAAAQANGQMLEQWAISELNAAAASLQGPPKPTASTDAPEAMQTPPQLVQAAASSSNIIGLPAQHSAAEEPSEYQVRSQKRI